MKSPRSRNLKLLSLAAQLGTSELSRSIKQSLGVGKDGKGTFDARLEQARLITENLAQMKGAAMKLGQLLSIDAGDYFPPEAMALLAQLQATAKPVDFRDVKNVMIEELGDAKVAEFDDLKQQAAAAASIGQVHRARLNGEDVAIKVQYPGISESIDSDIDLLRKLAGTFVGVTGREMDLSNLFVELKRVLAQEADYTYERSLMTEYGRHLVGDPLFRVPRAIDSHSARRVLTMTWEKGATVDTWLKSHPSLEKRTRLARSVLDLFCREFFDWGLVQTDPNFANFLVSPDDALVLLDFGATLRYDVDFRERYRQFLVAVGSLDPKVIIEAGISFELLDSREGPEAKQLFAELLTVSVEPFLASNQPFQFEDSDYAKRTRVAGSRFGRSLKHSPPPERIIFLHRKLGGIFNLVKRLDVRLDLSSYWEKMTNTRLPG